jgi:hypothetical protein
MESFGGLLRRLRELAMSPQERMQSAAALHNAMAEMRAGLSG